MPIHILAPSGEKAHANCKAVTIQV